MQKVYLLLRNNQQTGPHSFEELLELHLKPYDLIWVEGKSLGWRYPTEIETLKPFFATEDPTQREEPTSKPIESTPPPIGSNLPKKIFVSMPASALPRSLPKEPVADPIEQKAEELRKRVQQFVPQENPVQTNYARKLDDGEEEYTNWVYKKKTEKKSFLNKRSLSIAAVGLLFLSGGWWLGGNFFKSPPVSTHETAVKQIEKIEKPVSIEVTNTTEDIVVPEAVAPTTTKKPTKTEAVKTEMAEKKNARKEEVVSTETTVIQNEPVEKNENDAGLESGETGKEVTAKLPPQKKKTFKERMSDLLKTRKPVEETVEATPMPSDSNGERTAKRRDDNTQEAPVLTDVSQQVEIKTNKIADSWMIGVKNLKLTLFNRSKLTITSAKLEVLYYSEQNNLIEKKILSFNNIPPNKSQTVAAPDQRLADHIEYKIIVATGIDNAYANN